MANMDAIIDSQFVRLEKALSNLVNSIATYNPAPQLATELVEAEVELTKGLEQLNLVQRAITMLTQEAVSVHQSNHARILSLRTASAAIDDQVRSTLTMLVETRAELIATASTVFSELTNPVSYAELLSYARRISKFTIPPTFREVESDPVSVENTQDTDVQFEVEGIKTNGTSTPIVTNGILGSNGLNTGDGTPVEAETRTALPAPISEWLNPLLGEPTFVPWPSEEVIRRGALASIQILLDQGVEPATFDPERSAELEAERKRVEEENEMLIRERAADRARQLQERRTREEVRRTGSVGMGTEKAAVFTGLDLLDDMDEED